MPDSREDWIHSGGIRRRISAELDLLRAQAEFRTLETPNGINLCSNDYLGLATDQRLRKAVAEAVARTPTIGSTGSRLLSGNWREWENAEAAFADFASTEATLYFSPGYAANVDLLSSVLKPGDIVFSDAPNHASLIYGIRLPRARKIIFPHGDLRFLEDALAEHDESIGARVIAATKLRRCTIH